VPSEEAIDDTLWPDWYIAWAWALVERVTVSSGAGRGACGAGCGAAGAVVTVWGLCGPLNGLMPEMAKEDMGIPFIRQDRSRN
jgi:hypothetical protein